MIVQVVISNAKPGVNKKEFRKLTAQMAAWLKKQKGFVSYELYESETGWADRIVWTTLKAAKQGNNAFSQTTIGTLMSNFIEPGFNAFMGKPVDV